MSRSELKDMRNLAPRELREQVEKLKLSLYHARTKQRLGQLKDTAELERTRKDIARLLTLLRAAEAASGSVAGNAGGNA